VPTLFSYGTLQSESVQLTTIGRALSGVPAELVGFMLTTVEVHDPAFVAANGQRFHANVAFTGNTDDRVSGTALQLTHDELAQCDEYERPAGYHRVLATLTSGAEAWVYLTTA
jgi:hypothetical protein